MNGVFGSKGYGTVLALIVALVLLPFAGAQPESKPITGQDPVAPQTAIRIEASPKVATVGDPVRLDLEVTTSPNYQVEVQKPDWQAGDLFIRDFVPRLAPAGPAKAGKSSASGSNQIPESTRHCSRVVIAFYKTGKFTVPPIQVKIRTAEGKEISAYSPPVEIEIRTVLKDKNPELKDLKKQAEIPDASRRLLWTALIAASCLLCGLGWYFWRKRKKPVAAQAPLPTGDLLDIAETDLRKLLAGGLPEDGKEKQFYVALSEVVKRILEAGYGIPAAEQTTSEIMSGLHGVSIVDSDDRDLIESFLDRCDVVKFAKYIPARFEHEAASQDALKILEGVRMTIVRGQGPA